MAAYGLLAMATAAGDPAFYTFDAVGNTSELTDATATVLNSYSYDAFGTSQRNTEAMPNDFEYVGQWGIQQTIGNMLNMRSRLYDPQIGRFTSEDRLGYDGGDVNLYRYAENQPVTQFDPTGTTVKTLSLGPLFYASDGCSEAYGISIGVSGGGYLAPEGGLNFGGFGLSWSDDMPESGARWGLVPLSGIIYDGDSGGKGAVGLYAGISYDMVLMRNQGTCGPPTRPVGGTIHAATPATVTATHIQNLDAVRSYYAGEWAGDAGWYGQMEINSSLTGSTPRSRPIRSWDPNDKLHPAGYGDENYILGEGSLAYTIRFENKASASAPAQQITITDTLDEDLDLSAFELTEIAFGDQFITVPPGLSSFETSVSIFPEGTEIPADTEVVVNINAALDRESRVLTVIFMGLDPETGWLPENPFVGILEPNDETGRGEGHVSYIVPARANLPSGTVIENEARIIFDWNEPIDTPRVFNTIDASAPSSAVAALPVSTRETNFAVSWSGDDDDDGSGVATYDIFYSKDGEPRKVWLDNTAKTTETFVGELGHTYGFFSVASDFVGHDEFVEQQPDTTIALMPVVPVRFDVSLVVDPTNIEAETGEVAAIPPSKTWIDEWTEVWAEIWISTPDSTDWDLANATADLVYNTDYFTATDVKFGPAFSGNPTWTDDDPGGRVVDIRADVGPADIGDDRPVLFARVQLQQTAADAGVPMDIGDQYMSPVDTGLAVETPHVEFSGPALALTEVGSLPATEVWPMMYDLDNDGKVFFSDFAYFASVFLQEVKAPYSYACDHDHSGRVDFADFAFFAPNFGHAVTDLADAKYVTGFPEPWRAQPLRLSVTRRPEGTAEILSREILEPVFQAAVDRIDAARGNESTGAAFNGISFEIVDLPGDLLGQAVGDAVIQLDIDAAGYGWFVDSTPWDDREFFRGISVADLTATPNGLAPGRADLLTVVLHELGHVLGRGHEDHGIMDDTLSLGTRRLPLDDFDVLLDSDGFEAGVVDKAFASFAHR